MKYKCNEILCTRCYKMNTLKDYNFAAHLRKIRREKGFSLEMVCLMLYRVTVTRNCVGIKIGLCLYPLGVYGCLNTYPRKILFLYICYSNSNPMFIGRKYLKLLDEVRTLSRFIRTDCGLRLER